ncbi:MAG: MBL fold metallo-hydrolase [Solirubrobacterales bacterium]
MPAELRILPLGGLGEIGKNMTAVETEGKIVLVDCGVMFPTAEMLGIDLVLPDFSSLRDRADDIEGIVLTHGHEDHVGALPYVLRELGIPPVIYGGPLTIGMVRSKLDEHKLRDVPLVDIPLGEAAEIEWVMWIISISNGPITTVSPAARSLKGTSRNLCSSSFERTIPTVRGPP